MVRQARATKRASRRWAGGKETSTTLSGGRGEDAASEIRSACDRLFAVAVEWVREEFVQMARS